MITLASHVVDMPNFASELALMIGLGVGVDYALFIVTRFRENYRQNGGDVEAAVEAAINTSGRAVLFAGATVVIALLGMFALGVSLLNGAAVAAAIGVVLVMSASLTLLPALLRLIGGASGRPAPAAPRPKPQTRRRLSASLGTADTAPTGAGRDCRDGADADATAPALGLRLASSDAGNDAASQTTRQAYDLLAKGFGPGFNGPLQVAIALPRHHDTAAVTQVTRALARTPGIVSVAQARVSPGGTAAALTAYPTTSPQSSQTSSLVSRLRDEVIPPIEQSTATRVYVGGATASQVDFSHVLSSKLPLFVGVVIVVAALLLLLVSGRSSSRCRRHS